MVVSTIGKTKTMLDRKTRRKTVVSDDIVDEGKEVRSKVKQATQNPAATI